jgi:two-component system LytT family response regulator
VRSLAISSEHLPIILVVNAINGVILNYSPDFVQIHKRYIVNINKTKKIQESVCILDDSLGDNRELRISKNYRQSFMAAFYSM